MGQPGRIKRNFRQIEHRGTHINRHPAILLHSRFDDTVHSLHPDRGLVGQSLLANKTDKTTRAIAALLDFAAIGIEDAIAKIDPCLIRGLDDQYLIGADAKMPVGQIGATAQGEDSTRWRTASMTTKSLPAPCILLNFSFIAGLSPIMSKDLARRAAWS